MMLFHKRPLIGLAGLVACLAATPSHAADPRRDDADRAFLKSASEGSITNPTKITSDTIMGKICEELQPGRGSHSHREKQRLALRNVYEVVVPPGAFRVGEYRSRSRVLPLDVQHSLTSLDGTLTLQVMAREGASFELEAAQADALAKRIDNKEIALKVAFRVEAEEARNMSPCFSLPKSSAWVLRIEPITYELVEGPSAKSIAQRTTPVKEKLDRFVEPGAASVHMSVHVEGALDPATVERAIEAKRGNIETCLGPVMSSAGDTGTLAFGGTIAASGSLADLSLEVDALDAAEASDCIGKVLHEVSVGKGAKPSRLHITIAVDRSANDAREPEVLEPPK